MSTLIMKKDCSMSIGHRSVLIGIRSIILISALPASASAQLTVINLNPAGATTSSQANSVQGGQQVGYALVGGIARASLWSGTAASWLNLDPISSFGSNANAVDAGQQVGYVNLTGEARASLWSGTAASRVDLQPAGAFDSNATG